MAPKNKGKKDDEQKKEVGFTEVEKTFLDFQLAECNRKVARLRTAIDEYEVRNDELQKAYDKLDEDRADIIAYLKKTLNSKNEENTELKDKVKGLEETREIETAQFKATVVELEKNFTTMKDQLTSENKLLAGKLNTLEEFRAIRDDLMRKFEKQEQAFKDQEMKYKRIIYDAEKKFIIGKDKLKKEMEARLLQLAQDFQDATELRIAASTHRVIRENIAINNELDSILSTQAKLADQNEKYKENERDARIAMELAEEERDKAINKNVVQLKVIDQLTNAFEDMKKEKALYEKRTFDLENLNTKIRKLEKENKSLSLNVRILEQNLHARLSDQNRYMVESSKMTAESKKLKRILREASFAVKAALKLDNWATTDPTREIMDRQTLLQRLLEIVTQYREITRAESMDTIASLDKVYEEGDLGFVPKPTVKKSAMSAAVSVRPSQDFVEEKEASSESSLISSSAGSIKTIPSIQLVAASGVDLVTKDSLPSLMSSTKSSYSESFEEEEEESEDGKAYIQKKIEATKLDIKKSVMKDLAYSRISFKSTLRIVDESTASIKTIEETAEGENMEGEQAAAEIVEADEKDDERAVEAKSDSDRAGEEDKVERVEKEDEEVEGEEKRAEEPAAN